MFRAMTWWMLEHGVDVRRPDAVAAHAATEPVLVSGTDPLAPTITVDGTDVAGPIRGSRGHRARSARSARCPQVRAAAAASSSSATSSATAASSSRAGTSARSVAPRGGEGLPDRGRRQPAPTGVPPSTRTSATASATRAQLLERDTIDSGRATAPLTMAEGAVHIDTTDLTLDEVVDQVVALVETSGAGSR